MYSKSLVMVLGSHADAVIVIGDALVIHMCLFLCDSKESLQHVLFTMLMTSMLPSISLGVCNIDLLTQTILITNIVLIN